MGKFDIVTGAAGFIGSHLVDALLADGREVLGIDDLSVGCIKNLVNHKGNPRFRLVQADVAELAQMRELFIGADRVFHLAALIDTAGSLLNPDRYFKANVSASYSVAEAARIQRVRCVVYASSAACYGRATTFPIPESAPIDLCSPYATTKYLGEQTLLNWGKIYGFIATSLRLFNVYGPYARASSGSGVLGIFLAQKAAGEPLTITGDGNQTRDFVHVQDVVSAFRAAVASGHSGIYNVGSGTEISIKRLSELVHGGRISHLPARRGEPGRSVADTRLIRERLGWRPQISLEAGIAELLAGMGSQN